MRSRSPRIATALVLGSSLWLTSVAAYAFPQQTQDQKSQTGSQPAAQQSTNKKPLSTSEDPTMIGKRNINKGIWAHGVLGAKGTESEIRLGRQLAAEVDRTAKFVDDPIITEYVNRVGQNIVLHSDAKVPFTIKVIDSDEVNAC